MVAGGHQKLAAQTGMRVIDYAWGRPSIASLKAAGAVAVCRYLSYNTTGKNLTKAEADGLRAGGIDIVSNWEQAGSWTEYAGGQATGRTHAVEANRQHLADGGPPDRPIYFSTDFNPTSLTRMLDRPIDPGRLRWLSNLPHPDRQHFEHAAPSEDERAWVVTHIRANTLPRAGQLATIADYYRGVASVIGLDRTGAYGGYNTIKYLFDAGVIRWGWQTYAWSSFADEPGGQIYLHWDPQAQLRQVKNGVLIGGVDCDLDDSMAADFGQWGAGAHPMADTDVPGTFHAAKNGDYWGLDLVTGAQPAKFEGADGVMHTTSNVLHAKLDTLLSTAAADLAEDRASTAAINALAAAIAAGGGSVDVTAILAAISAAASAESVAVATLTAQLAEAQSRADALHVRLAAALGTP